MQIGLATLMALLSLALYVYSRPNVHGWKLGRKHRNWIWDSPIKKRSHAVYPSTVYEECCPTVTEIVQPKGGVSKSGRILELYTDKNSTQSFYQTSCGENVAEKPCRYVSEELAPYSRCTQRYSYSYALVREYNSDLPWRLDFIRVRSGCSCEISITRRRRPKIGKL
uniref:Venom protein n=1 Tax=Hadrurus spadix TaxID=141984 RepID=A0A1W7R976_9SCOR